MDPGNMEKTRMCAMLSAQPPPEIDELLKRGGVSLNLLLRRYDEFSQAGSWVGFGLPNLGIAVFWVAVVFCVIFCQARGGTAQRLTLFH